MRSGTLGSVSSAGRRSYRLAVTQQMCGEGRLGTKEYDEGKRGGDCRQGMVDEGRAAKTESRGMWVNLILLSGSEDDRRR